MSAYRHAANHQHFAHTRDAVAVHRYTFIRSGVIGGYRNRRSAPKIAHVDGELEHLFSQQNGVATSGQILTYLSRYEYELAVKTGSLERILLGIYCRCEPTNELRLRGLDLSCGSLVPVCLASAVALFGFDTEDPPVSPRAQSAGASATSPLRHHRRGRGVGPHSASPAGIGNPRRRVAQRDV